MKVKRLISNDERLVDFSNRDKMGKDGMMLHMSSFCALGVDIFEKHGISSKMGVVLSDGDLLENINKVVIPREASMGSVPYILKR